jgi:hypothetical protein
MENELFIWFNRGYKPKKGTPLTDDIVLFDSFDNSKKQKFFNQSEWMVFDYKPMTFPPQEEKYKFPKNQFLIIKKKIKDIFFDYIEYGSNVKIFSENLFDFLIKNGLDSGYEIATLSVVDKFGNRLTDRKYVALRFGLYNDDLFDYNTKTKQKTKVHGSTNYTFPDLSLKDNLINKSIFVLNEFAYRHSIIFKKDVLQKLLNYYEPEIYRIKDFTFLYENQYDEEILPLKNSYHVATMIDMIES